MLKARRLNNMASRLLISTFAAKYLSKTVKNPRVSHLYSLLLKADTRGFFSC